MFCPTHLNFGLCFHIIFEIFTNLYIVKYEYENTYFSCFYALCRVFISHIAKTHGAINRLFIRFIPIVAVYWGKR